MSGHHQPTLLPSWWPGKPGGTPTGALYMYYHPQAYMKDVTLISHVFCAVPTGHHGIENSVYWVCCKILSGSGYFFPIHVHVYWWGNKRSPLAKFSDLFNKWYMYKYVLLLVMNGGLRVSRAGEEGFGTLKLTLLHWTCEDLPDLYQVSRMAR